MRFEMPMRRPFLLFAVLAVTACGDAGSDAPADAEEPPAARSSASTPSAGEWQPTPAEIERAEQLGRSAAGRLAGTLIQQLSTQLAEGGPEAAIEFCADEAMELTQGVNVELGALDVKRTSNRVRNPENAPDELERAALAHFESEMASGALPESWVQTTGEDALRYYQPLVVADMCVQCHGPADALQPAVRARLQTSYPEDQAVGYAPGDFRGLIRVVIPREALEEG